MLPQPEHVDQRAERAAEVRQPVLRGRRDIAALWFPADWFDQAQRQARLLDAWQAGASAWRFAQGDLLRFAQTLDISQIKTGSPLVLLGQTLSSAVPEPTEQARLPGADVWIVQGARVQALQFAEAERLDPSRWLALDNYPLVDTWAGQVLLPATVLTVPEAAADIRAALGAKLAPADPAQLEFMQALRARQRQQQPAQQPATSGPQPGGALPGWNIPLGPLGVLLAIGAVLLLAVSQTGTRAGLPIAPLVLLAWAALRGKAGSGDNAGAASGAAPAQAQRTVPPRAAAKDARQPWRDWLARIAMTTRLSRALGLRQAAYVRRMMAMFEKGDLDAALRHAIPLGAHGASLGQAFGTPSARQNLDLRAANGAAASFNLGEDLNVYLRKLYRQTFEQLDRQGRIDEAVFVLAELLEVRVEALDYLEKHQRFEQAAALALGWNMAAEIIVRLYCLAGDWKYAVAIARRDNAFASAIAQMEKKWPDAARTLRGEWAVHLAAQGHWLQAAEVIWPLESARARAADWLQMAERGGAQLQARALVMRAALLPDTLTQYDTRLLALGEDPDAWRARAALAEAAVTLGGRQMPQVAQLVRAILPMWVADQVRGHSPHHRPTFNAVVALARDPLFGMDLPTSPVPAEPPRPLARIQHALRWDAPAAGGQDIRDAVPLEDGAFLLALGEAGAISVDQHGKTLRRFAAPADQLVFGQSGQVALALARRDSLWRVSRLDLLSGAVTELGMGDFDHVANEFDGAAWTVAKGNRVQVLDVTHSLHEVLWQVADLPGPVVAFAATRTVEQFVVRAERDEYQLWRYQLPLRRLQERREMSPPGEHTARYFMRHGGVLDIRIELDEAGQYVLAARGETGKVVIPGVPQPAAVPGLHLGSAWYVFNRVDQKGDSACFHVALDSGIKGTLHWPAGVPRVRVSNDWWLAFDANGRLFFVDEETGATASLTLV
ncbi:bpX6 domain-containing protein [Amantichitinum ursilacus]|uniref:MoxR-vWA-beta-propeller ternary system domain-containing protein n=1 Tax=Amantichitinum ursilacus TaxID=857265 RepID=A0A0N0XJN7_9NEIS|nr:bpX6 domain-containing protein [Amantichitinum ursilacus]KPC53757.1 hypothetical protein WG78_07935 [Amantichitinum ursilacus]